LQGGRSARRQAAFRGLGLPEVVVHESALPGQIIARGRQCRFRLHVTASCLRDFHENRHARLEALLCLIHGKLCRMLLALGGSELVTGGVVIEIHPFDLQLHVVPQTVEHDTFVLSL